MTLYLMCHYHTTMKFQNTVQENCMPSIVVLEGFFLAWPGFAARLLTRLVNWFIF